MLEKNLKLLWMMCVFEKATGEPPLLMAFSVHLALRNAINAAKFGTGDAEWYRMGEKEKCY